MPVVLVGWILEFNHRYSLKLPLNLLSRWSLLVLDYSMYVSTVYCASPSYLATWPTSVPRKLSRSDRVLP